MQATIERQVAPVRSPAELKETTRCLRLDVLDLTFKQGGHASSCFSCVEILTAVYFGGILRYRPLEPAWPDRDRFFLSKGHAAPLMYPVLAHAGYIAHDDIHKFRVMGTGFHGHPKLGGVPGIEQTSGSLGQGLSVAIGHVLAGRLSQRDYRCYVLMGDGECEEGQVWEAAMAAAHWKLGNLTAIVDYNKYQQTGPISREMNLEPFAAKWQAFGWHTAEANGRDMADIVAKLHDAQTVTDKPQIVFCHTAKGQGVSFMETDYTFHGRPLTAEQMAGAREEINAAR
jgi:transketolase